MVQQRKKTRIKCPFWWFIIIRIPCSASPSVWCNEYTETLYGCNITNCRLPSFAEPLKSSSWNDFQTNTHKKRKENLHDKFPRWQLNDWTVEFDFKHLIGWSKARSGLFFFGFVYCQCIRLKNTHITRMRCNNYIILFTFFNAKATTMQQLWIIVVLEIVTLSWPPWAHFEQWHFHSEYLKFFYSLRKFERRKIGI